MTHWFTQVSYIQEKRKITWASGFKSKMFHKRYVSQAFSHVAIFFTFTSHLHVIHIHINRVYFHVTFTHDFEFNFWTQIIYFQVILTIGYNWFTIRFFLNLYINTFDFHIRNLLLWFFYMIYLFSYEFHNS